MGGCACAYHARCIDLVGLVNESRRSKQQQQQSMHIDKDTRNGLVNNTINSRGDIISITICIKCQRHDIIGLEVVPLCSVELDKARRQLLMAHAGLLKKRMIGNETVMLGRNSVVGVDNADKTTVVTSSEFYDPSIPRTGRWTDEELAFRDALITHFDQGALPLSNGTKLNDFLSSMLKSKQSRLTKRMKHAKLSSKFFRIQSGYLMRERDSSRIDGAGFVGSAREGACTFSKLEYDFINSIADPIERSEITFHMQREWREHIAGRLTYLRINFDATSWLRSVDAMDRRVTLERNRSRMAKRRSLMGKAMEKDVSENMPGVFINQRVDDFSEVVGSDMKIRRVGDYDVGGGGAEMQGSSDSNILQAALATGAEAAYSEDQHDDDGELNRFLMSVLDEAPIAMNSTIGAAIHTAQHDDDNVVQSLLGGNKSNSLLRSSCDPNFRSAAPFLAGITLYMERNGVPFEHVDVWVPSVLPPVLETELSTLLTGSMGSGINHYFNAASPGGETYLEGSGRQGGVFRLRFAGSATLGMQIVDDSSSLDFSWMEDHAQKKENTSSERDVYPLTGDEIFNYSLFGQYSSKFSFSAGYGLPGRVFQSGIAAWEQFVANAPPEMFERRGGAIQFGIKTALGLPIECEMGGRIVLVLYSKHNREKDQELVNRFVKDIRWFNPCPRWKLVVDVGSVAESSRLMQPPPRPSRMAGFIEGQGSTPAGSNLAGSDRNDEIMNLVTLLQEQIPFDHQSLQGAQLDSMMSLRMILLRTNCTSEEEQLIDMMLVLFKSYIAAGRTRHDIAKLLTRDYDFHHQMTARPLPMGDANATSQMVQQGSIRQRLPVNTFRHSTSNNRNLGTEVSPTTTAASTGTFISYTSFLPGNFPSTPFT